MLLLSQFFFYIDILLSTCINSDQCSDKFLISPDNDSAFRGAGVYCGRETVSKESEYSQLSLAYTYTSSLYGYGFNCTVSAQAQPCDCGWSQRGRIVGGTNAAPTDYPSMAAIGLKNGSAIFCDGTIISSRAVLTAAHCTNLHPYKEELFILCGYTYLSSMADSPYSRTYDVSRIIQHPNYNSYTKANDIAILITSPEMEWSRGLGPICMPLDTTSFFEYYNVDVCGWGTTSLGGPRSNNLQKASVNIIPNQDCQQVYPTLQQSQMCTYASGRDACQLDSGGPVYYKGSSRMYLFGINSFGKDCGQNPGQNSGPNAGVNTRITSFLSWIVQNVNNLCDKQGSDFQEFM